MTASAAPAPSACRYRASRCASPMPRRAKPLAQGEIGVIEVRGRNVFKGYWNMPEKTTEEFRADGFFITGDLGQVDADGYVTIVGRAKDLVISGGYNIYPKEVEMLLDGEPGVAESAVIGVPHPDLGEGVVASRHAETGRHTRRGRAACRHRRPPRPLQAAAPHRHRRRVAAQHDGQGPEEFAARALPRHVQGMNSIAAAHRPSRDDGA